MRKLILGLSVFILTAFSAQAQQITGFTKDAQGAALEKSTVSLLNARDSSVVKLAVSNKEGKFAFQSIQPGRYLVSASHIGHNLLYSGIFEWSGNADLALPDLMMNKSSGQLKEVVVTAKKPMIEVRADKTIVNVEGTINAVGNDAMELLRKSPGVLIDKDDNLSLAGKNGVQVYIDGRPTPLAGKDLADFLRSLQSSQVEAIEIITNPSAKYDAAGNAGIINIRLKKNKSLGTNGSVNAGYNIGIFAKYNTGLSLNHRNKKFNLFGNYNYNQGRNENFMNLYRTQLDTLFDQQGTMTNTNRTHGFKVGMDYFLSKRSTLGLVVNGNIADNDFSNYSRTPISYLPSKLVNRILVADNTNEMSRRNANFNLNFRHTDSTGRELNMDADYGVYRINSNQMQPNFYFSTGGVETNRYIYNMIAPTDIDIYSFKTDYEQNFKKGRLGMGAKFSYVKSGNQFERFNVYNSGKLLDTLRSNNFNYNENINAAYVSYNRQMKKFMFQAGLRVENTNATGKSTGFKSLGGGLYASYDSGFTRNYTNFFPSAGITFNKNPMNQWGLNYSRRIDRPAYQDLNPFEFKLDEYTFQKGNTQLRPQYTNTISLTNTYKYRLTTQLSYSHVKDVFTQLVDTAELSKSFISKQNLATQDIVSLNISYPFQKKWYSFFANLSSNYSLYKANFGAGRTINLDAISFNFYSQHSFKLGKGYTGELSGWYASPGIWQGTFRSKAMWTIDAGMQKTILNGKGTVKMAVSDIFQTLRWAGTSNFAGQYVRASGGWESRLFKLNLNYRFGRSQVKAARDRKTGLEEESKRVQNQGGGLQQ